MEDSSLNHYEEQLYSMFKSFDVNNEESLDEPAVHGLCAALQLEERGAALVRALFEPNEPTPAAPAPRVSFASFRSGLLAVLGEELPQELEPRFVLGSKRYGRRSRPAGGSPRASSASRVDTERDPGRARRSASASPAAPAPAALHHDTRIDNDTALALCRSLRMDAVPRQVVERIFEDSTDTTVGEFFQRLDSSLASAVRAAEPAPPPPPGEPPDADADAEPALAAETVAEEWERAGVRRPRRLLAELGFAGGAAPLRLAELERALDEELRAHADAPPGPLVAAALAVARLRGAAARRAGDAARAERDKLRGDVGAWGARAALLAREVDEREARAEAEQAERARTAAARQQEEARRARAAAARERERWEEERARLQAEAARRAEAETRARGEAAELARRCAALEERLAAAEAAREAGRAERVRLAERLSAAEEGAARAAAGEARAEEARARAARELRAARDGADELAAALAEARRTTPAPPATPLPPAPSLDTTLSAELGELLDSNPKRSAAGEEAEGEAGEGEEEARDEECARLRDLVRSLEAGLEAMRAEYEACEEYWADKLRGERRAHEAELRAADARLADLLARVAGFEARLALPPIPEAPALEAQVLALEAELRDARARPAPPPPPRASAACARCRRLEAGGAAAGARAARAEAAARRLHARLLAADLLVKELYVENCQLARPAL